MTIGLQNKNRYDPDPINNLYEAIDKNNVVEIKRVFEFASFSQRQSSLIAMACFNGMSACGLDELFKHEKRMWPHSQEFKLIAYQGCLGALARIDCATKELKGKREAVFDVIKKYNEYFAYTDTIIQGLGQCLNFKNKDLAGFILMDLVPLFEKKNLANLDFIDFLRTADCYEECDWGVPLVLSSAKKAGKYAAIEDWVQTVLSVSEDEKILLARKILNAMMSVDVKEKKSFEKYAVNKSSLKKRI